MKFTMTIKDFYWEQLSLKARKWIKEQAIKDNLTIEQEIAEILNLIAEDK